MLKGIRHFVELPITIYVIIRIYFTEDRIFHYFGGMFDMSTLLD